MGKKISIDPENYLALTEFDQANWRKFNKEQWTTNKEKYISHLLQCWGKFPPKTDLDAVFIEEELKDGYRIEKYELMVSSTGETLWDFIPVWILVPDKHREMPCPAMVIHHQHAGHFHLGKKEPAGIEGEPEKAFGLELVKQGYIVAVFDALAFEERQEPGGEKFTFTRLLMYGVTLNGKYCYDTSRVVDFLRNRKDVARDRIGIMGHSLGGQMAIYAAIFDPGIKVIVSSCGFARISGPNSLLAHHINHNFALYLPNFLDPKVGMDMHEIIGLLHPRPLILSNGAMDKIFPIEGVAEIHKWVEDMYADSGNSDDLCTLRHVGAHYVPAKTKEVIYQFIAEKL